MAGKTDARRTYMGARRRQRYTPEDLACAHSDPTEGDHDALTPQGRGRWRRALPHHASLQPIRAWLKEGSSELKPAPLAAAARRVDGRSGPHPDRCTRATLAEHRGDCDDALLV